MKDNTPTRLIAVALAVMAIGGVAVTGVVLADTQTGNDDTDAQQSSYLRVVHAAANASAVDVTVDDETVASDLAYGNTTNYLDVPAGNHTVTITAADDESQVLFDGEVYLESRTASTLAATTATQQGGMVEEEPGGGATTPETNETETPTETETEDPLLDNETETPTEDDETDLFGENETETPGETMTDENETETPTDGAAAPPGENGDAAAIQPVMFLDNAWEPDEDSAALSAVHLAADAPAVDVTVPVENATDDETETPTADDETDVLDENETETPGENETTTEETETTTDENETTAGNESGDGMLVLAEDLEYRSASDYVTVPAGEHTVQIREAAPDNSGEIIRTVNVTVEGGTANSALVLANATDAGANATETPGMNATETPTETETEEPLLDNETETPTDETETTTDDNETMAGDETQVDGEGETTSVMVELTQDVTYTLSLPGEETPAEGGAPAEPGEDTETPDEEATPTPEDGEATPTPEDGEATPTPEDGEATPTEEAGA